MASGSFEKVFHNSYKLIVNWTSTATQSSNSSVVKAVVKLYCPYSLSISARSGNTVVINGTSYSYNTSAISTSGGTTHTLATINSSAISHNSDGTKSITITANFNLNATLSGTYYGTQTASSTVTLDTIARASTVSCNGGLIGNAVTIVINKASSDFWHALTYTFGSLSGTITNSTSASSYSWTLPSSFYNEMGSATSKSGTITCKTYSGETVIGTSTCSFTAFINENTSAPTVRATVRDTNSTTTALTGDSSVLVLYYSNAQCTISATAKNGATISSYSTTHMGTKKSGATTTFTGVTGNTFICSATDSRGYSNEITVSCDYVNYKKLTCNLNTTSPNAAGNMSFTITGSYFNGSFGASSNTLTVQYRYKASGGSYGSWTTVNTTKSGNSYSASVSISGLDYRTQYTFQARATDKLATVTSGQDNIQTTPVFDWSSTDFNFNVPVTFNAGATGVGGGAGGGGGGYYGTCSTGASAAAKVVVCDDFTTLETGASIRVKFTNGNTASHPTLNVNSTGAKSIKKYGTTDSMSGMWYSGEVKDFVYDGTYWIMVDGGIATSSYYGVTKLSTSVGTSTTTALTPSAVNDLIDYGAWTPTCNVISSYSQRYGNYMKVGNMCTISFCVIGTARTSTDTVTITGLPYTPYASAKWQAGGGNFANGYTNANSAFAGWVIENGDAIIYARSTVVNSTKGDRTSGYIGAQSGTTIYMSGTIMYRTT